VREAEVTRAAAILGLEKERLLFLRQPDTQAPHAGPVFDAMVELLVNYVAAFGCSALLAPWRGDPHGDHLAASLLGMTAAQAAGVRAVAYPVWGWTLPDAAPVADATMAGWRLDVTQHLATKRRAIAAHASQHGRLIADDTSGFHLPRGLLAAFDTPWETFLLP
jgi:LmbE family N-acetylglucosaminyl deacetylase